MPAPGIDKCDDELSACSTTKDSVSEWKHGKPYDEGSLEAGAEKSVVDEAGKFTRGEDFVMNFCAGVCPAAKACLPLSQHRKFPCATWTWTL